MGAKDYAVDVADIPKYGPPNMAAELYSMIRGIPQAYEQGQENQFKQGQRERTERLQAPYTGPLTPGGIIGESIKRGGIDEAKNFIAPLIGMQSNEAIFRGLGASGEPPRSDPSARADAQTGAPLRAASAAQADKTGVNAPGEPPGRNDDVTSLRGLATQYQIDVDSPAFKKAFGGIPLDREDFHPTVVKALDQRLRDFAQAQRDAGGGATASLGQGSAAIPGAGGMAGGAPAPPVGQPGTPPVQMAQAAPARPGVPQDQQAPWAATPAGTVPEADRLDASGRQKLGLSALYGASPKAAEAAQKAAENDFARAKAIRELSAKYGEKLDPRMVEAATREEVRKGQVAEGIKEQKSVQARGQTADEGNQKLAVMRTQMSDPNFFTGAGQELVNRFKQWSVSLGGDPNAASPVQEFHKTAINLLNEQIRTMAQSGYSRIQVAEIRNLKESIANKDVTPATNRYLIEEMSRLHNNDIKLADFANQYAKSHLGYLDEGWPAARAAFLAKPENRLFTQQEIEHPQTIAPAYLPTAMARDPAKIKAFIRNQGLNPDDPVAVDDFSKPPGPDGVLPRRLVPASAFMK